MHAVSCRCSCAGASRQTRLLPRTSRRRSDRETKICNACCRVLPHAASSRLHGDFTVFLPCAPQHGDSVVAPTKSNSSHNRYARRCERGPAHLQCPRLLLHARGRGGPGHVPGVRPSCMACNRACGGDARTRFFGQAPLSSVDVRHTSERRAMTTLQFEW